MKASPFLEPFPAAIQRKLHGAASDGRVHIRVAADIADDLTFSQRWLVVTDRRVVILGLDGDAGDQEMRLDEISAARIDGLLGGGRLVIERHDRPPAVLYFSGSLAPKFAEVAAAIHQLSRGREPSLPAMIDRTRCEICGRLLPERNGICPVCADRKIAFLRIATYLKPYRGKVALLLPVLLTGVAAELLPPLIVRRIMDKVLAVRGPFQTLVELSTALAGARLLIWTGEISRTSLTAWLGGHVIADIRTELHRHLLSLPVKFLDGWNVGMLMSRVLHDAGRIEEFLANGIPLLCSNALLLTGVLALLFYLNWSLTILLLAPIPLIVLGATFFWGRLKSLLDRQSWATSRQFAHLSESLAAIRVVKAFSQEDREAASFDSRNRDLFRASARAEAQSFSLFSVIYFVMSWGLLLVWYFGGRQVVNGRLSVGELLAIITYLWMLYWPLQWFGQVTGAFGQAMSGAGKVFQMLGTRRECYDAPDTLPLACLAGQVTFNNVTFGYDPSKPVLHKISLVAQPGQTIGIIGKSGTGKTTMINLLARFYDPDGGSIALDGTDIRSIHLEDLRRQIALVPQEPFLFSDTIARNIGFGEPGASFDEIVNAARIANAHSFIVAKPDSYDTLVGERGLKLSAGERQRIAIARAVLRDAPILILDEATSSLDTENERLIHEAIGRHSANRTTFILAHRLSTVRSVDCLVVLDDGRIVEMGSPSELIERRGTYYDLLQLYLKTSAALAVTEELDEL
jgi:ATP-binding cassette subfamily B protein